MNAYLIASEVAALKQWRKWLSIEQGILKQKSRVQWLQEGDAGTHYFYAFIKHRQSTNNISKLIAEDGIVLHTKQQIHKEIQGYYKQLLGSSELVQADIIIVRNGPNIPREGAIEMVKPVTLQEVQSALWKIYTSKAPGIDG